MKGFGKFSFQTMLLVLGLLFVVYLIFHSMKYEGMKPGGGGGGGWGGGGGGGGGGGSPRPQNPKWGQCQGQFNNCMSSGGSYVSCQPQRESCLQ